MSKWEEVQLKDIVSILGDGLHGTPEYCKDGEYYFINGNNLNEGCIEIDQETKRVSYSEFLKYKKNLNNRTLLVSINGTLGNVAYYKGEKVVLGKSACYFNLLNDVDRNFIRHVLSTPYFQKYIQTYANGTTIKNVPLKAMREFSFSLPPLQKQKQISNILCCLDRKIENLRKQNETLEAIAQTLFKRWFVDFEFPNEDDKPYKSSGGEMERSKLGEIPKGWRVGKLGEFCNVKHGYAFKGESITTEETDQVLLTPGNFKIGGGFNSSKYKYYSDDDYDEEYILTPGDLIITMTDLSKEGDTLGYPAFVPKYSKNIFLHNQRLGKVVDSQIDPFFLFFLLCRREYRSHILGTASGSTVRHTSPSRILEYGFAVPGRELLDRFSLITSNLICKSFSNHEQIQTLTKIRDVLLPKLMSGKLRIKD
jgi:type I restriction enzyme S subunit